MRTSYHGKYTKMHKNSPRAIARCDYSGFMVRHSDLARQMQYRGTGLVWTGFLVHKKFLDVPNQQDLTPLIKLDPVPIPNARPDNQVDAETTLATSVGVITLDVSGNNNITLTNEQFNNGVLNFKGVLTGNIIIYVPNTYNQFYANNITTGAFTLSMQLVGNPQPPLVIPAADPITLTGPQVVNTFFNLQIVYF